MHCRNSYFITCPAYPDGQVFRDCIYSCMYNQLDRNYSCCAVRLIGICPWCMHVFAGSSGRGKAIIAGFLGVPLVSSTSRVLMTSPAINGARRCGFAHAIQPDSQPVSHWSIAQADIRPASQPASHIATQPANQPGMRPVYSH